MKVFLASFFLIIFSLQIIPVKEVGKILFKQMLTEEIHEAEYGVEDDCNVPGAKLKKDKDPYASMKYGIDENKWCLIAGTIRILGNSENFAKQYTPDILTPPPNCA